MDSCVIHRNIITECSNAFRKPKPHIREVKSTEYTEVASEQEVELIRTAVPINITLSVSAEEVTSSPPPVASKVHDWKEVWPNKSSNSLQALFHVPDESGRHEDTLDIEGHQCFPVLPLARIKYASDFTDTFLIQVKRVWCVGKVQMNLSSGCVYGRVLSSCASCFQGPEWYSTWLSVQRNLPVFTHLTLLPFTDIGGTLNINILMNERLMVSQ